MSTQSMGRRLDKVTGSGGGASFADAMDAARERAKAWHAAGNTGPMRFDPLPDLPPTVSRASHELRAAMLAGRARVKRARELYPRPK